jgi:hypothetical protein
MFRRTFLAAALFAVAGSALAQSASNLSGAWRGGYISSDGNDINEFTLNLVQSGSRLSGSMVEVNLIGNFDRSMFLTSNLEGTVSGRDVVLVKTYDGSGGVSHSVRYSGTVSANGRTIKGTYDASGATGKFEFAR